MMEYDRKITQVTRDLEKTITITFPKTVAEIAENTFSATPFLRSVVLNEGLNALGSGRDPANIFAGSGIRQITVPKTV